MKRSLMKIGRVTKKQVFRVFQMRNQTLLYFKSAKAKNIKGYVDLYRCVALSTPSPIVTKPYAIRVRDANMRYEFYVFPNTLLEQR